MKSDRNLVGINKKSWSLIEFGDFVENINTKVKPKAEDSKKYIGLEHLDSGSLHISRWGTDVKLKGEKIKMNKGDIIFGKRNAYLRRASRAPFDGICSAHAMVLRPKGEIIAEDFFPFFINSTYFMDRAIKISVGSLSPTINWSTLSKEKFQLPPIDEQRKIAKLLKSIDRLETSYQDVLKDIQNVRHAFFEEFAEKPENNSCLGDCLVLIKSKSSHPHKYERYVGLEHIESGSYEVKQFSSSAQVKSSCNVFTKGQLLYSKLRPNLDKAVIASFDGICTSELLVYEVANIANINYILNHLHSKKFVHYATSRGFGTKMPRVSHEIISNYKMYLPSITKQSELLSRLDKYDASSTKIINSITDTRSLRDKIMNEIYYDEF